MPGASLDIGRGIYSDGQIIQPAIEGPQVEQARVPPGGTGHHQQVAGGGQSGIYRESTRTVYYPIGGSVDEICEESSQ